MCYPKNKKSKIFNIGDIMVGINKNITLEELVALSGKIKTEAKRWGSLASRRVTIECGTNLGGEKSVSGGNKTVFLNVIIKRAVCLWRARERNGEGKLVLVASLVGNKKEFLKIFANVKRVEATDEEAVKKPGSGDKVNIFSRIKMCFARIFRFFNDSSLGIERMATSISVTPQLEFFKKIRSELNKEQVEFLPFYKKLIGDVDGKGDDASLLEGIKGRVEKKCAELEEFKNNFSAMFNEFKVENLLFDDIPVVYQQKSEAARLDVENLVDFTTKKVNEQILKLKGIEKVALMKIKRKQFLCTPIKDAFNLFQGENEETESINTLEGLRKTWNRSDTTLIMGHHVTGDKNDFKIWIKGNVGKDIIGDLADSVGRATGLGGIATAIKEWLDCKDFKK